MIVAAEVSQVGPVPTLRLTFGPPDPAAAGLGTCLGMSPSAKSRPPVRYFTRCTSLTDWNINLSANAWISLMLGRITHAEFVQIVGPSLY